MSETWSQDKKDVDDNDDDINDDDVTVATIKWLTIVK